MDNKSRGRLNRQRGANWELKVRDDLIEKGWIIIKNPNNVIDEEFKQGKCKYNPFTKRLMMKSGGFPDFICWYRVESKDIYLVIGVEAKSNGSLDKVEREKCKWLLDNKVFSQILIAKKKKEGRKIVPEYIDFKQKYEVSKSQ